MKALIHKILSLLLCLVLLAGSALAADSGSGAAGNTQAASGTAGTAGNTQTSAKKAQQSGTAGKTQTTGPVKTAADGWVYQKNSRTDTSFTGIAATSEGWLYFENGVFDPLYCGIVSNENGSWYVKNGTIAWSYSGLVTFNQKQWYIRYGQVRTDYTGMLYDDNTWYFINEGIAWHYTGSAEAVQYGTSENGRPLMAYRFGTGKNILLLTYAIHGYEDAYAADGSALVYAAFRLMRDLDGNLDVINARGWSVYIVPCANPDGLLDGTSANGTGRLTAGSSSKSGTKYAHGIDLNRSFPYIWKQYTESRNYNGSTSLCSSEARALYQLATSIQGKGYNICIDVHGWYNQVIATSEENSLYKLFHKGFPGTGYAGLIGSYGYFSAWAYSIGYNACLFEFPAGIHSFADFRSSGYTDTFNLCIMTLLQYYGK